jgi:EmrB/QacA subfamily drug resistance transporter
LRAGFRTIALTVSAALFMPFLDATALNTALPAIAHDLHVGAIDLDVVILSYQLALAAFIPLGSLLAERIGARNAFAIALLVFVAGSLLCALSTSVGALVAARALQGLGGAVMAPVSRQLVVRSAAKSDLIAAMNWLLVPGILAPILGPPLGGYIVTYGSWHWIFLINVPIGLLAVVMTLAVVPDLRDGAHKPFDLAGVLLTASAIFCLVFGLESAARPQASAIGLAMLAASGLLTLLYIRHARTAPAPVLDLSLLSNGAFRHSMVAGTFIRVLSMAAGFLFPLWFQLAMGMSPARAGTFLVMIAAGALCSRLVGASLVRALHPRVVAIGGTAMLAVAFLACACLRPSWPPAAFYAVLWLQGLASAVPMLVIGAVAYVDIAPERTAAATGFYSTIQQLGLPLGVTTAVWTLRLMHGAAGFAANDSRAYVGGLLILAAAALIPLAAARKLSVEATGALRAQKAAA